MMKRKRTRPTPEDWARWEEGQRQLAERVAILEQESEANEPLDPELRQKIERRAHEILAEERAESGDSAQRLLAERIAYNDVMSQRSADLRDDA